MKVKGVETDRKKMENQKMDGGKTARGAKWREAAGRKMN